MAETGNLPHAKGKLYLTEPLKELRMRRNYAEQNTPCLTLFLGTIHQVLFGQRYKLAS